MGSHSHRYVFNLLLEWDLVVVGASMINTLSVDEPPGSLRMPLLERGMGTLQAGAGDLIGPHARPTKVLLDYPAPAHLRKYEETSRCPLYFNQQRCRLHYTADYLATALPIHDPWAHDSMDALQASLERVAEGPGHVLAHAATQARPEPRDFSQAFKRWTGLAPSDYRKSRQ